jgi:hypothetical protein
LPDKPRRVAVLVAAGALAIGLLSPLTARSASPLVVEAQRLLAIADTPSPLTDRGPVARSLSASRSLATAGQQIGPEELSPAAAAVPPSLVMTATMLRRGSSAKVMPPPVGGTVVTGKATWYCCSAGWRGQAAVALPGALGGHYDAPPAARFVTVCADRCVLLPIVDYCGCFWGTASQKVADLSPEAWAAVTDRGLSAGVVTVTLHFG